jgi:hypothetical protein
LAQEKKKNAELTQKNQDLEKQLEEAKKNQQKEQSSPVEEKTENNSNVLNKEKYLENILEKDEEIKALKKERDHYKNLADGKGFISVIFVSEDKKICYSVICKNDDKIANVEEKLFEKYPELKENDSLEYFINGKKFHQRKTLRENKISNGDIITLKLDDGQ